MLCGFHRSLATSPSHRHTRTAYELCFPGAVTGSTEINCPHCGELLTVPVNDPMGQESYQCSECSECCGAFEQKPDRGQDRLTCRANAKFWQDFHMITRYAVLISLSVFLSSCSFDNPASIDMRSETQSTSPSTGDASSPERLGEKKTPSIQLLDESQARKLAADFANHELADRKFFMPSGDMEPMPPIHSTHWYSVIYVYRDNRIRLRMGGSGGPEATVSFRPDGSEPKLEHAEYAWD